MTSVGNVSGIRTFMRAQRNLKRVKTDRLVYIYMYVGSHYSYTLVSECVCVCVTVHNSPDNVIV